MFQIKYLLLVILSQFLLLTTLQADQLWAVPKLDFEVRYAIGPYQKKLFPSEKFEVLRESSSGYFVEMRFEDTTHIVELNKLNDSGRSLVVRDGNVARPNGIVFADFAKGVILFNEMKAHPVKSKADGKVYLPVRVGGKEQALPFPERLFVLKSGNEEPVPAEDLLKQEPTHVLVQATKEKRVNTIDPERLKRNQVFADKQVKFNLMGPENHRVKRFLDPGDAICIIETEHGVGTGFICNMDGHDYVISNLHVVANPEGLKIMTRQGNLLKPVTIEGAQDRDLVRIRIPKVKRALFLADEVELGEEVTVYGNSDGAGVVTELEGTVLGDGYDRLEVSANFVRGNSGSPIVNKWGKVIGVATYATYYPVDEKVEDWIKKGTRFAEPRRFGVKISDNIKWVPVHPESMELIGGELANVETTLHDCWAVLLQFFISPYSTVDTASLDNDDLKGWAKAHNEVVKEYQVLNGKAMEEHEINKVQEIIRNRGLAKSRSLTKIFKRELRILETMEIIPELDFYTDKADTLIEVFEMLIKQNESLEQQVY